MHIVLKYRNKLHNFDDLLHIQAVSTSIKELSYFTRNFGWKIDYDIDFLSCKLKNFDLCSNLEKIVCIILINGWFFFAFFSIIKSVPKLTISRLLVKSADQSDAGNYACSSEAGYSNTTAIHVITGNIYQIHIQVRNQVWYL